MGLESGDQSNPGTKAGTGVSVKLLSTAKFYTVSGTMHSLPHSLCGM